MKLSLVPVARGSRKALLEDVGLRVHSHPRSGTHWLQAVLNENFVHAENYYDIYWNRPEHGFPDRYEDWGSDLKRFYIFRRFDSVAYSFLKPARREQYGLSDISLDKFAHTPWNELVSVDGTWKGIWEGSEVSGAVLDNHGFALETRTPYEFWNDHVTAWLQWANEREDVLVVEYEALKNEFQKEMAKVGEFLGKPHENYVEVTRQVGWSSEVVE